MNRDPEDVELWSVSRFEDCFAVAFVFSRLLAVRIGLREPDAEDVALETMTRAFVHWARLGPEGPVRRAWCARVATNLAIDLLRRRRPDPFSRPPVEIEGGIAARVDVASALRRLPRRQRQVVALRYLVDLPIDEVSAILGVSPGSIKQHASRGLDALRPLLGDRPESDMATPTLEEGAPS
jgi:RNA polymerase sigma factor (sigma-70 family)